MNYDLLISEPNTDCLVFWLWNLSEIAIEFW